MYKISPNIHKGRVLLTNIGISETGNDSSRKPLNASSPDSSKMVHPNDPRRPRLTWRQRLRRLLYVYESPLNLRGSLIRLRHRHKHSFFTLRLFLPLPTWYFPSPRSSPPENHAE